MKIIGGVLSDVRDEDIINGIFICPDGVTEIGNAAFDGRTNLESVIFPNGLRRVGDFAFRRCSELKRIELPDGLVEIGTSAFVGTSLEAVNLPESLTMIGRQAFFGTKIKSIVIPGGVVKIDDVFSACKNLESITFLEGLTEIGHNAFRGCKSLALITLPGSLTRIGDNAFPFTSLKAVVIEDDFNRVKSLLPPVLREKAIKKEDFTSIQKIQKAALNLLLMTPEINPLYKELLQQKNNSMWAGLPPEIFSQINKHLVVDNEFLQAALSDIKAVSLPIPFSVKAFEDYEKSCRQIAKTYQEKAIESLSGKLDPNDTEHTEKIVPKAQSNTTAFFSQYPDEAGPSNHDKDEADNQSTPKSRPKG